MMSGVLAPAVDRDLVVESAQQHAVGGARGPPFFLCWCGAPHTPRQAGYTRRPAPLDASKAAKLRRVIIAARFKASRPDQPTPEEISILCLAWEDAAA